MSESQQPPKEAAFFTTIRGWGLTRGPNGLVGGVVEGLGARMGMAAVPARLIVVLAWFLLPGLVMLAYAAGWGLLPDRRGNIIIQNFGRGVTNVGALLGIAVLTLFGFGGLDAGPLFNVWGWGGDGMFGAPWDGPGPFIALVPLGILAGIVVLVVALVKRSKESTTPPAPPAPGAPEPTGTQAETPDPDPTEAPDASTDTAASRDEARDASPAQASSPPHTPQPWEPALLPGDPRTGVQPSRGAAAGVAYVAGASAVTAAPASAAPTTPPATQPYDPTTSDPAADRAPATGASAGPPPAPYAPPRPKVPGPGKAAWLAFLGVLLVAAAIVFGIDRAGELAVSPILAWGALVTAGLGLILVIVSLAGRRLGFLGFMSVVAVLLSLALAANADEIRASDEPDRWDWWRDGPAPVAEEPVEAAPEAPPADLTEPFADDYASVFVGEGCWPLSESDDPAWAGDPSAWNGAGQASIRLDDVAEDATVDVGPGATRLAVPAGTSVIVTAENDVHLVWAERDLVCDAWPGEWTEDQFDMGGVEQLRVTNSGDPVVTVAVTGDNSAIFIEEVDQ